MALSGSVNTTSYDGRYYKLSWTATQSIANNQSTISWKIEALGGNDSWYAEYKLQAKIAGAYVYNKTYTATTRPKRYKGTVATGTKVITHDANGAASFTISLAASIYSNTSNYTGSGTFTLNTIPRKSTLSVGNGTLNTAQTLTVTRKSTSFTHTIVAKCGTASSTVCTKSTSTSISFKPPLSWASQNTTGTSVSVTYTITTYNGSTSVGSNSYTKTCTIPASVKPSVEFTVEEASGNSECKIFGYVQSISKLKIVVTPTTSYGSPIASYKTTVDGKTYTSSSFTTGALVNYGTLTVSTIVTDKRGRTATYSKTISVQAYKPPVFNGVKVHRCNEDGSENMQGENCELTFESNVSVLTSLDGLESNKAEFEILCKPSKEEFYTAVDLLTVDKVTGSTGWLTKVFPAESGLSYNVKIIAHDRFSTVEYVTVLSTGFTIMHFLANGLGMALGKIAELTGVLDIGFKTRFMGGILQPVLEAGTDFNSEEMRVANTYTLKSVANANYSNCPLTSGTGILRVETVGEEGQTKQTVEVCHKTNPIRYERFYYQATWGDWICTSDWDGTLLWSDAYFMHSSQTITLSELISKQRNGIVLVFSEYYDGAASDTAFHCRFIPKMAVVKHPGRGHCFQLSTSNLAYFATKYLYISDDKIVGHDNNDNTGTGASGITYTNNRFVMRYVIGV